MTTNDGIEGGGSSASREEKSAKHFLTALHLDNHSLQSTYITEVTTFVKTSQVHHCNVNRNLTSKNNVYSGALKKKLV
jgi:hypothetical protein